MHELSLAHSVCEIAVGALREQCGAAGEVDGAPLVVGKVRVRVGDLSGVDPEALAFCFEVVRGEWVETAGSALEVQRCPVRVRCLACGRESEMAQDAPWDDARCGSCGEERREVTGGRELEVFGVELVGGAA